MTLNWVRTSSKQPDAGPAFSVTGATLRLRDYSRVDVKQAPFQWVRGAWDARLELTRTGGAPGSFTTVLRLTPAVWDSWTRHGVDAEAEAARQLALAMLTRDASSPALGVVTLQTTSTATPRPGVADPQRTPRSAIG